MQCFLDPHHESISPDLPKSTSPNVLFVGSAVSPFCTHRHSPCHSSCHSHVNPSRHSTASLTMSLLGSLALPHVTPRVNSMSLLRVTPRVTPLRHFHSLCHSSRHSRVKSVTPSPIVTHHHPPSLTVTHTVTHSVTHRHSHRHSWFSRKLHETGSNRWTTRFSRNRPTARHRTGRRTAH